MSLIILDGGMGRELHRRGAPFRQPEWSALALTESPHIVTEAHLDFIHAGAEVITTNAYAVVPFHIGKVRFQNEGENLAQTAAQLARDAVEQSGKNVQIAGSLPPLFGSYRPDLFDINCASEIALPLINGQKNIVDIWLAETQSSIAEALFVRHLLRDDEREFWVSFTLEDTHLHTEPMLRSGETVADAVAALMSENVAAVLFNCSQPEVMADAVGVAKKVMDTHSGSLKMKIGVYANAFEPQTEQMNDANDGLDAIRPDITPEHYLQWAKIWCELGANIVGGCCGITPEHIAQLQIALKYD
ncbi:homocysteine S-methyltransferase family protein [Wielerella bovis]|uniref:homocysteine S-methyltransferase family protein n=1 Tax=Wielerella bovis TaxID=2917790 RepID=UPI002019867B|nr:homocysteine S-methyltransferase family protein [Wielerella bovis]ULJ63892.1 homocysteine S-methyltransferase family protein [Wielerella bovis]ULJ68126.1 homocysteine S-methyltransferase family protein [Wielerella bovis]